jgi:hypothetical protein
VGKANVFRQPSYARRLKAAGFSEARTEALADANRELLMPDLAVQDDIASVKGDMSLWSSDYRLPWKRPGFG